MGTNQKIQVPMKLVVDMQRLLYYLSDYELDTATLEVCKSIERGIQNKIAAMEKRDAYTQSKMAPTEFERESARQKYLDLAGIHKDFRYGEGFQP